VYGQEASRLMNPPDLTGTGSFWLRVVRDCTASLRHTVVGHARDRRMARNESCHRHPPTQKSRRRSMHGWTTPGHAVLPLRYARTVKMGGTGYPLRFPVTC
jgi:hypothetical protein